jgi:glycosyltransferase involved in cell wall biosynthesis
MTDSAIYPKVSIIMPTYNRAPFLRETIESIRAQSYPNWELIILDDGSDDNTEEIIAGIKDERIRYFKSGKTGWVSKLRNEGIKRATGELIAFNDSDDLWHPAKLEKQVAALHQHPETGFSLTGGYNYRNKNEPIEYFYRQREGRSAGNLFVQIFSPGIAVFTQTLLVRRRCVDAAGYFDESKPFSDPDFVVNLALHFDAVILFEPLLYRRLHDSNDSGENWEKRYHDWAGVIRAYRDKKQLPGSIAKQALFKLYINYGERTLQFHQSRKAIRQFMNAWRCKPYSVIPFKKTAKAILLSFKK